jgi:hypothetical protein
MIDGTITKPGPGGGGAGQPPPFRVTVPSVDVDWEGFAASGDENGEDARHVIVPFTNSIPAIRWLLVQIPYDDYGPVHPIMTLHCVDAHVLRLLNEDGTSFPNGGQIDSRIVPSWPIRFRAEPLAPVTECIVRVLGEADNVTGEKATDTIRARVVNVDLDVEADGQPGITDGDEPKEENPGGYACVGTNNLTPIKLTLQPGKLPGILTLSATMGGHRIRVWRDAGRTVEVSLATGVVWNADAALPSTLYVEGIASSAAARDVELRLEYDENPQGQNNPLFKCADVVRLTVIKAEFDHAKVNTRNLHHVSDPYLKYDHCVAEIWRTSREVNLEDYLTAASLTFKDYLDWYVDGTKQSSSILNYGREPGNNEIRDYQVHVAVKNFSTICDRLIFIIVPTSTQQLHDDWITTWSANTAWFAELPAAYSALAADNTNPEPETCSNRYWNEWGLRGINNYHHPEAVFDMRSNETPGGHGHQACYTGAGAIITSGVSAGTADSHHYSDYWPPSHVTADVLPFVRAAQLDGNPVWVNDLIPTNFNRPMMFEGSHLQQYLQLRPPIPNSKPLVVPGTCVP